MNSELLSFPPFQILLASQINRAIHHQRDFTAGNFISE